MAQITADRVRVLREKTGAGMMDCKKALEATGGDLEAAEDELRKKGIKKAEKKAGRTTGEGRVAARVADDGRSGAMVSLSCETDFVAKTPNFEGFLEDLLAHVTEHRSANSEEALAKPWKGTDQTLADAIKALVGKLGENMQLGRVRYAAPARAGGATLLEITDVRLRVDERAAATYRQARARRLLPSPSLGGPSRDVVDDAPNWSDFQDAVVRGVQAQVARACSQEPHDLHIGPEQLRDHVAEGPALRSRFVNLRVLLSLTVVFVSYLGCELDGDVDVAQFLGVSQVASEYCCLPHLI